MTLRVFFWYVCVCYICILYYICVFNVYNDIHHLFREPLDEESRPSTHLAASGLAIAATLPCTIPQTINLDECFDIF